MVGIPIVLIQVQSSKVMRKDQISGQVQRSKVNVKLERHRPPHFKWVSWKRYFCRFVKDTFRGDL